MEDRKLMVIDDDPDTAIILKTVFEYVGFEVIIVEEKAKCVAELENGFRGVIIVDINIPYFNGWYMLDEISRHGYMAGNRLIILSSDKNPDKRMDEFSEYIDDFIIKPFDIEYLLDSVKKSLKNLKNNMDEVIA
ncbi:MAG: response regulator [Thermoplasmatales archaeon]|nr:response regulator [Thermoplasmatales archaeon]